MYRSGRRGMLGRSMGYRSYNRKYRRRRDRYSSARSAEPGLVDDGLDGIVALVARFFRWVFGIRPPAAKPARRYNETRAERFARIDATVKRWETARIADAQPTPYRRAPFL